MSFNSKCKTEKDWYAKCKGCSFPKGMHTEYGWSLHHARILEEGIDF